MKILVDVNLTPDWVELLLANEFDAVHWSTVGDPRAPDAEIMQWARRNRTVVFTHDLDFGLLLALTRAAGPSVLQLRSHDTLPVTMGNIVLSALREHSDALQAGGLVTVEPGRARVRVLPIGS